jgi:hypothetical protein
MSRQEYPDSKLKDLKPTKAWAGVSYDTPPEIWQVEWYREDLQPNLRHIRVTVTPILPKPRKKPAAKPRKR